MSNTFLNHYPSLTLKLKAVLEAIYVSVLKIEHAVRYASLTGLGGNHSNKNSSGEVQQKLDVVSNDIMIHELIQSGACNILISEENKDPIHVPTELKGDYLVAFDPLDGSSNIDCNAPIGTIFSIYENKEERVLVKGDRLLIAGYVLYGPATEMMVSINNKVDRFVLYSTKDFVHVETVHFKNRSKRIYSINESNEYNWNMDIKKYIHQYKKDTTYTSRYIGSMVGDVHRTLLYGGVFCYPADKKNLNGKLRLMYECYPMAKLIECAGGKAIIGNMSSKRILEVEPTAIHQRSPILLGSNEEVDKYIGLLNTLTSKL